MVASRRLRNSGVNSRLIASSSSPVRFELPKPIADLAASEAQYRKTLMAEVRKTAPIVDPTCWWVVLETHPDATPAQVKAAFREKMKECHPDRVDGLAAPIQQLAKEMAQRLTAAVDQYNATNTG